MLVRLQGNRFCNDISWKCHIEYSLIIWGHDEYSNKKNHFRGPSEKNATGGSARVSEKKIKNKTENPHHVRPYDFINGRPLISSKLPQIFGSMLKFCPTCSIRIFIPISFPLFESGNFSFQILITNIRCAHEVCMQTYSWRASTLLIWTFGGPTVVHGCKRN